MAIFLTKFSNKIKNLNEPIRTILFHSTKDRIFVQKDALKSISVIICFGWILSVIGQDQKNVILQDHWIDTSFEAGAENARFNDVWGFTQKGENYAVIGSSQGSHFFHIVDQKLIEIDFEAGKFQNRYVEHRDFKTYKNYLYGVCDEGTSSLQIFDLSYLPDSVHKVYDSSLFFQICHNIYIDTATAKLFASGANNIGMLVFDLSNPTEPLLIESFNSVNYVHDCYVRNDTAFLNCGFDGLQIYNFASSPPAELGMIDFYPNQGYNHSGWLAPTKKNYVFIDETKGTKLRFCEWNENLGSISITETFATSNYQDYVPHNIILLDYLAFVAYYNNGFRIFDLSVAPFKEIGVYDTFLDNTNYKLNGAWGVYVFEKSNQILISDRQNGLFLFSFPILLLNQPPSGTIVSSTPFLDENSYLIPRDNLAEKGLFFSIYAADGSLVYEQENYLNYVQLPLILSAGTYIYSIYNSFGDLIETGKFVKGN